MNRVYINGMGMVSSAGADLQTCWQNLISGNASPSEHVLNDTKIPVFELSADAKSELSSLQNKKIFRGTDPAVILGLMAAKEATKDLEDFSETSVLFASSRGASSRLEQEYATFSENKKTSLLSSPQTTAGSFSAIISRELGCDDLSCTVSSACASANNATALGYSMIKGGMTSKVIVGGAEFCVNDFTLTQLNTIKIYEKNGCQDYPSRPLCPDRSGMVLGEGSGALFLSNKVSANTTAEILGFGSATEPSTLTGISPEGEGLKLAIGRALKNSGLGPEDIDVVIGHGASTVKGDAAEAHAYQQIFEGAGPLRVYSKWLTGHTLGASGAISLCFGAKVLETGYIPGHPYWQQIDQPMNGHVTMERLSNVLVVGMGFGGYATAMILSKLA